MSLLKDDERPIDLLTLDKLHMAFLAVGIQLDWEITDKIIDVVELLLEKSGEVTIDNLLALKEEWAEDRIGLINIPPNS